MSYLNENQKRELNEFLMRDAASLRSMSFGEKYIKETIDNTRKWADTGLLMGVSDSYIMRQLARLMENQRLINETSHEWSDLSLKRASIPVVRRVFGSFAPYHWVSVQVLPEAKSSLYVTGLDERTQGTEIETKTSLLRAVWRRFEPPNRSANNLDHEAEITANYSVEMSNYITREIANDLAQNAGSQFKAVYSTPEKLLENITGMASYIGMKLGGREANWMLASETVINLLRPLEQFEAYSEKDWSSASSVPYVGKLAGKISVFEDKEYSKARVLLGYKDNRFPYLAGYFYCPYMPIIESPGSGEPAYRHMTRFAKKLIGEGAKFYGVISIDGLPESEPDNSDKEVA